MKGLFNRVLEAVTDNNIKRKICRFVKPYQGFPKILDTAIAS
jgi:hypothetical protein